MNSIISCPLCNHPFQDSSKVFFVNSSYTSLFPLSPSTEFKYFPSCCTYCGVSILVNDANSAILGSLNPSVTYKEPSNHIPSVALKISNLMGDFPCNLVSTGPKNNLFIHYLQEHNSRCSIIDSYNLTTLPHSSRPNILFLTRIIEHINSYTLLDALLTSCNSGDILYIEILDFSSLYSFGNFSFFWNERITYPSKEYLINFFALHNFYPLDLQTISSEEPFHTLIFIKQSTGSCKPLLIAQSSPISSINLNQIYHLIHDRMANVSSRFKSISFYGIGHKSLTLVDFIIQSNPDTSIILYDGSGLKVNRYYKRIIIHPLDFNNLIIIPNSLHIFSFYGHLADSLRNHIRAHETSCSFATVKSLMHFNDGYQEDKGWSITN